MALMRSSGVCGRVCVFALQLIFEQWELCWSCDDVFNKGDLIYVVVHEDENGEKQKNTMGVEARNGVYVEFMYVYVMLSF